MNKYNKGEWMNIYPETWVYGKEIQFNDLSDEVFEKLGFDDIPQPSQIKIHEGKLYRFGFPSRDLIDDLGYDANRELHRTKTKKQGAFWLTKVERIYMEDLRCISCKHCTSLSNSPWDGSEPYCDIKDEYIDGGNCCDDFEKEEDA